MDHRKQNISSGRINPLTSLLSVLAAVVGVALAARLSVPISGSSVPQSAQTLAVLMVGILLGSRLGAVALVVYVALGVSGLPIFADGAVGVETLVGPTGGYLLGFVLAALIAGWWTERGKAEHFFTALPGMLLAHAVVLLLGWAWLSGSIGPARAFSAGVAPFWLGALLKSALAALFATWISRRRSSA